MRTLMRLCACHYQQNRNSIGSLRPQLLLLASGTFCARTPYFAADVGHIQAKMLTRKTPGGGGGF
jgi:hypothetical protein